MKVKNVPILVLLILLVQSEPFAMGTTVTIFPNVLLQKGILLYNQFTSLMSVIFSTTSSKIANPQSNYFHEERNEVIKAEKQLMTGSNIILNDLESKVNEIFLKYKSEELNVGENNLAYYAPSLHFFRAKRLIEKSKIFHFLQKMPKGAVLHIHNTASVSSDWVVQKLSYMDGLLRCINRDGVNILTFRNSKSHDCATRYVKINEERNKVKNNTLYDTYFEKLINLYTPNPETTYSNTDAVWTKFQNMFSTITDALMYINAFRAYHWQMLKEMYEDNIMYAEIRTGISELYEKDGTIHPKERTVRELLDLVNKFCKQYPKFLGIKIIYTTNRRRDITTIKEKIEEFKTLQSKFPNFIVGFDLVGQEDKGEPLQKFASLLSQLPNSTFFFHSGETNRFGTSTDHNLVDAILLNTKRIGHGYMLMKHPLLRFMVKMRKIAIEVCPISNQVLHLTEDLRNHPVGNFIAEDLPIVISNDDPGFWGARGLSYDFYYAIMSFAPQYAGLELLKALVTNSLRYSAMSHTEKEQALSMWNSSWETFLNDVLRGQVI